MCRETLIKLKSSIKLCFQAGTAGAGCTTDLKRVGGQHQAGLRERHLQAQLRNEHHPDFTLVKTAIKTSYSAGTGRDRLLKAMAHPAAGLCDLRTHLLLSLVIQGLNIYFSQLFLQSKQGNGVVYSSHLKLRFLPPPSWVSPR